MYILGVHIGHDSSVALIKDGKILADVAEERFTRLKHYCGLPINAIDYCLKSQGISIGEIDVIAVPSRNPLSELNFLFNLGGTKKEKVPKKQAVIQLARRMMKKVSMKPPLYIKDFPIANKTEIFHVEHHLAHAASAYYTSGIKEKQLIVTMDGAGDDFSICLWQGENGIITPLKKFPISASLGWFYSNVTEAPGWWHGDGEGKTMGLAPYGNFTKVRGVLDKFYPKFDAGDMIEHHDFGIPYFWNQNGALQWHFEDAGEIKKLIEKYGRENIAAEAQRILEEQTGNIIFPWLERLKTKYLCCAGGVFLNVKLNQRIWESRKIVNSAHLSECG